MTKFLYTLLLSTFAIINLQGQQFKVQKSSEVIIKGTSTMHDWESTVSEVDGQIELEIEGNSIRAISSLDLSFKVESIESGKKKMDKLTHKAFESHNHPQITFIQTSVKKLQGTNAVVLGNLTMAGNTRSIEIEGTIEIKDGEVLVVTNHTIDMTTYGMEKPTAMLGAIKVGPEVTVHFRLSFK